MLILDTAIMIKSSSDGSQDTMSEKDVLSWGQKKSWDGTSAIGWSQQKGCEEPSLGDNGKSESKFHAFGGMKPMKVGKIRADMRRPW